jgi:hypothetical protein
MNKFDPAMEFNAMISHQNENYCKLLMEVQEEVTENVRRISLRDFNIFMCRDDMPVQEYIILSTWFMRFSNPVVLFRYNNNSYTDVRLGLRYSLNRSSWDLCHITSDFLKEWLLSLGSGE